MVKLAGPTPSGEGMERRLIELATHLHPGLASISSMFIQEKRQWGGSEKESRKEQQEGVEYVSGEGKKDKRWRDGNYSNMKFDGHVEGVRGS